MAASHVLKRFLKKGKNIRLLYFPTVPSEARIHPDVFPVYIPTPDLHPIRGQPTS